jgi:tetratricopeptide (TPR) repeat protein
MFVFVLVILGPQMFLNPIRMARLAQTRGDFASARDNWSRVLSLTEVREAYLGRAWANRELGYYPSAIADYDKAISLGANRSSVWRDRAYAFLKAGDYKSAIADYDRLPTDAIDARIGAERDYAQTMLNPPAQREPAPPIAPSPRSNVQLVILYLNESKKPKADEIASFLTTHLGYSHITVRPYKSQIVEFKFVDPNELRYFSPGDRTAAETIAQSLRQTNIPITPRLMPILQPRPGYFEIWLRDQ